MAACIHESGHAVIAHWLGVHVCCVSIAKDGSGKADVADHDACAAIPIAFSGGIAEEQYCEIAPPPSAERSPYHHKHDDKQRAWKAAQTLCPDDLQQASELMGMLQLVAKGEVTRKWEAISRLAIAVYDEGFLSGPALYRVFGSE